MRYKTYILQMLKSILHFNGLYGELNANYGADYIFSELIKTRSQKFGWVIRPHIHNRLFQMFCVESGKVIFQGNNYEKELIGPFVIVIPPMSLHGLSYSPDVKGTILTISDTFLEAAFPAQTYIISSIIKPEFIVDFEAKQKFKHIQELILQIDGELFSERPEKQFMVKALLCQLFVIFYRMFEAGLSIGIKDSAYLLHFKKFQHLIKTAENDRTITAFANDLNITPIHLNRVCKSITNKPAIQLVHEHAIREAEKYLKHTSLSVSEIAYLLKFEYPNYFSKLFKKYTRVTPMQCRNGIQNLQK